VPIDVQTPESDGWWLQRLSKELRAKQSRLELLDQHFRGEPPLPTGAENAKPAYAAFQKKARTNLARLIVQAVRQRMKPTGFRTAAEGDENGDKIAWALWKSLGMTVKFSEVARSMGVFGEGYIIVGLDVDGKPIVTAEDARQVITANDPVTGKVVAALKQFHDPVQGRDFAYLYRPGRLKVASHQTRRSLGTMGARFAAAAWDWDEDLSADLPAGMEDLLPVIHFPNEDGVGEFEPHLADLDRINHMILQRMVIATMQAFRQRALKGDLPDVYPAGHPQAGQEIDYDGIFVADPGALWLIPGAAEIWESGATDLTPILSAVKDDVRHLSAASQTPLAMFNPEGANQTAEGAISTKEDFVFKVEDRRERADLGLVDTMAMVFRLVKDDIRANREAIQVIWAPAERHSLQERADAASKATTSLPPRAVLTEIWQFAPNVVDDYLGDLEEARMNDPVVLAARSLTNGA
jgi:hypothetical protein